MIIQYGYLDKVAQGKSVQVTLPKAYSNTNYITLSCPYTTSNSFANPATNGKTVSSFCVLNITNTGSAPVYHWISIG